MKTRCNLRLLTLLGVTLVLAGLLLTSGLSQVGEARTDGSCRFAGWVELCGQAVPEGTVVTATLASGPSWSTTTVMRQTAGGAWGAWYVVNIPRHDPAIPQEGGVDGEEVSFSVTVTYDCPYAPSVSGTLPVTETSTWQAFGYERHHLYVGTLGDANLDGQFDVSDWIAAGQMAFGQLCQTPCADVNQDGDVTLLDWIEIYNMLFPPPP